MLRLFSPGSVFPLGFAPREKFFRLSETWLHLRAMVEARLHFWFDKLKLRFKSRLHAEEQIISMSKNPALGSWKGFLLGADRLQVERRGVDRLMREMNPSFRPTVFLYLNNIFLILFCGRERQDPAALCSLYSSALTAESPGRICSRREPKRRRW